VAFAIATRIGCIMDSPNEEKNFRYMAVSRRIFRETARRLPGAGKSTKYRGESSESDPLNSIVPGWSVI
jgi:hypothetical protein